MLKQLQCDSRVVHLAVWDCPFPTVPVTVRHSVNDLQVNLLLALGLMHAGHTLEKTIKKPNISSLHSGCHQTVKVLEDVFFFPKCS